MRRAFVLPATPKPTPPRTQTIPPRPKTDDEAVDRISLPEREGETEGKNKEGKKKSKGRRHRREGETEGGQDKKEKQKGAEVAKKRETVKAQNIPTDEMIWRNDRPP